MLGLIYHAVEEDIILLVPVPKFWQGKMSKGLVVESSSFRELDGNLYIPAVVIGGVFALVAMVLSAYLIFQHLRSYTKPEVGL